MAFQSNAETGNHCLSALYFRPSPIQCRLVNQSGFLLVEGGDYVSVGLCSEQQLASFPSVLLSIHACILQSEFNYHIIYRLITLAVIGGVVTRGVCV